MKGVLNLIKILLGGKTDISTLIDKYIRGIFLCNRPRKKFLDKMFIFFMYKFQTKANINLFLPETTSTGKD